VTAWACSATTPGAPRAWWSTPACTPSAVARAGAALPRGEHAPGTNNVENEVDRYIAWPGQALGYKLGQREILRLREQAQRQLGRRFRLADFHDRLLENGPVSLAVLAERLHAWIAGEWQKPEPPLTGTGQR